MGTEWWPPLLEAQPVRVERIGRAGVHAHQATAEVDTDRVDHARGVLSIPVLER